MIKVHKGMLAVQTYLTISKKWKIVILTQQEQSRLSKKEVLMRMERILDYIPYTSLREKTNSVCNG